MFRLPWENYRMADQAKTNYYFELASHNRRDGGKDHNGNRITYDAPEPNGKPEKENTGDCKS